MTYVPVVTPPTPPSPRVRELAGLLRQVLEEYKKAHPATTRTEIRAAVRMALMSTGGNQATVATVLSLVLGLGVAVLGFGLFFFQRAGEVEITAALPMIIAALLLVFAIAMFVIRNRQ
ncbi:MAG: hypothetical protein PVJ76_02935 [Gemmatimonadota bacterium]